MIRSKEKQFDAVLLEGHKQCAVEVPFNPATEWDTPARRLWKGRNGHNVQADVNGVEFDSWIVPRSKAFFLIIEDEIRLRLNLQLGNDVSGKVWPRE